MTTLSELLAKSFDNYKRHFVILIKLSFLFYFIPQLVILVIQSIVSNHLMGIDPSAMSGLGLIKTMGPLFIMGIGFGAISGILKLLLTFTIIKVLTLKRAGRDLTISEAISESSNHFFAGLGLSILTFLMIAAGFMFLVIPGIILMIYLTFTLYAFIVDNTTFSEAWNRSWELVKGNWWRTLGYFLVLFLIIFGIGLVFGLVTMPFSIMGVFLTKINYIAGFLFQEIPSILLNILVIPMTVIFGELFYVALKKEKNIK